MTARLAAAIGAALATGAVALACASRPASPPPAAPVPDTELGLSKTSVFDAPAPPPLADNESAPGERPPPPRPYPLAPPRIPHAIRDFLPLTRASNACVDCHGAAKAKEPGQPTPIPASHYTDLRHAPGKPGEAVVGSRWVCTACHVQATDAKPLVGNGFRASGVAPGQERSAGSVSSNQ